GKLLKAWLVAYCRMGVRRASTWLAGILTGGAVHGVELLRCVVIGLQVIVSDRPCRRQTAVMFDLAEIFLSQTKQRGAEEFRIAADVIVGMRVQLLAVFVVPLLFGLVFSFEID